MIYLRNIMFEQKRVKFYKMIIFLKKLENKIGLMKIYKLKKILIIKKKKI